MSQIPDTLRYAASHEWVRVDNDLGTVGISDHAQAELSDVVYVDLPKVGVRVKAGTVAAVVESVKAASDIYAPVSGEVVEINGELTAKPELINQDPYGAAWLFRVKIANAPELETLMDAAGYKASINE
jgi:glycine cleavage system H protein